MIELIRALAENYRWSWHVPTQVLFEQADATGFAASRRNPYAWLRKTGDEAAVAAFEAADLTADLTAQAEELDAYLSAPSADEPAVAYFCMEYGIHESLPIYSGGLGILAGDHVKEVSDQGLDFVALGMLYPDGYLLQGVDAAGNQLHGPSGLNIADHPLRKLENTVRVGTPIGNLHADVYLAQVGRTRLFLLDTDVARNTVPQLRHLNRRLYGGDRTTRIRQEVLLGVGGFRLLVELGLAEGRVLHMNEGHCAFALAEAVRSTEIAAGGRNEALAAVRARSVFTTHTPVPAGHDRFEAGQAWRHLNAAFDLDEGFVRWVLDKAHERGAQPGSVCMTVLGLNLAERVNGVSRIHGRVSRDMWDGFTIGYVTNGVHVPSWVAPEIRNRPAGADLAAIRTTLRTRLVEFAKTRLSSMSAAERTGTPSELRPDILTVGFARRFAPYKRATLLLKNEDRLAELLLNPERPVQFVYAGKAHPADQTGQQLMKLIVEAARNPRFGGRIHFLPDYDMQVGRLMVAGADVWLNTPRRPLEASGTSGQKAAMNGCLNCSVPDGWWPEGYNGTNGWVVGPDVPEAEPDVQDAADVNAVFDLLENHITPAFYAGPVAGAGEKWLGMVKDSITTLTPQFSAERMIVDYLADYYRPAGGR